MVEPKFNTEDIDEHINQLRAAQIKAEIEAQNQRINNPAVASLHALRIENARLKEALRECLNSLCEYVDVDSPGKMSDRKGRGQKAVARACEVLGDA